MNKIFLGGILFLLLSNCKEKSTSKTAADSKEPTEKVKKDVIPKTDKHIKIPNSHLYIIPPAGFSVNETSGTLGKGEAYANFIMMKIISGYTPEKLFSELKVEADKNFPGSWKQEDIAADGHSATLYQYKTAGFLQHYLVFTDGYTDEMIVANYQESEAAIGKEMYEAMKTVVVEN